MKNNELIFIGAALLTLLYINKSGQKTDQAQKDKKLEKPVSNKGKGFLSEIHVTS